MNPLVSICIPTYNAVEYIDETIQSFLNQNYKNIEIIIQDDCSTDGTFDLVSRNYISYNNIKIFSNAKNAGIGPNWNAVYTHATGEYIIIANADDIFLPDMISTAINKFNESIVIDAVSFKYKLYIESTEERKDILNQQILKEGLQVNLFEMVLFKNPFHIIFTVFKKTTLDSLLLTGNNLFMNTQTCDFELLLRLGRYDKNLYYIPKVMGYYRKHDTNNSAKPFAELYSWLYDVLPVYLNYIKENCSIGFRMYIRKHFFEHLKQSLKKLSVPNIKLLKGLLKVYNFKEANY